MRTLPETPPEPSFAPADRPPTAQQSTPPTPAESVPDRLPEPRRPDHDHDRPADSR
jgi:hypothetical protein